MKTETQEQATARRAIDAARKREERKVKREEKARLVAEKKANEAKSFPEYWLQNRANLLTEAERAEKEARESDVLDLEFAMKKYIDGNYDDTTAPEDRVPLEAIIAEAQSEVATNGLTESIILVVPRLWTEQEKNLRERILAKGGATATLLQYGYRTAIDSKLHTDFHQKFLMKRQPRVETQQVFVSLKCTVYNAPPTAVSSETASAYARTGDYKCVNCSERAARIRSFAQEQRSPDHIIFDGFGRFLDQ